MIVRNILQRKGSEVISVAPDISLHEMAKVLRENKIGAVLVLESDKRLVGVISERDLVIAVAKHGGAVLESPVRDFMTEGVYTCSPDDDIKAVLEKMTARRIRHLPVVEDSNIVGIISIGDAVKHRIAETEAEAEALKAYITTSR
ncbi:CBS domain-containing protein [Luteithermobacter gelatinilyticus]|uniref:CBS domain-containing protein n=1 Tax=Luteithermobacter gelatinilyticus TaxID=2582913 RepID=UPI001AEFF5B0|nr:CBS domain-containing protein [Luteithermobacter gelatinilyticus]